MTTVGQIEKKNQARVLALFHERLGYDYLGNWIDRPGNAEILSDMDAEIATLEARRDKTRLLKQGMMQELLTGRIRLV